MSLINALNWRYAVKQFNQQRLNDEQIEELLESVRLAPSAYGLQPYQLIVVTKEQLKQACIEHSYGQDKVANCSHLLVLAYKKAFNQQDISKFIHQLALSQGKAPEALASYQSQIENDLLTRTPEQLKSWSQQQCYIALGTLLASAAASRIDACPMTGFENQGIDEVLGLTAKGLSAAIICPVGYRSVDDHAANRPKHRLSKTELVINL